MQPFPPSCVFAAMRVTPLWPHSFTLPAMHGFSMTHRLSSTVHTCFTICWTFAVHGKFQGSESNIPSKWLLYRKWVDAGRWLWLLSFGKTQVHPLHINTPNLSTQGPSPRQISGQRSVCQRSHGLDAKGGWRIVKTRGCRLHRRWLRVSSSRRWHL